MVEVRNEQGLHARPADMFVRHAKQFDARIEIIKEGERFDGKSILSLMTLAAVQGTKLVLEATGPDADEALGTLAELFEREFDEERMTEPAKDSSTDG
jgi:phosphotransferase system HPr (HPr) family protein